MARTRRQLKVTGIALVIMLATVIQLSAAPPSAPLASHTLPGRLPTSPQNISAEGRQMDLHLWSPAALPPAAASMSPQMAQRFLHLGTTPVAAVPAKSQVAPAQVMTAEMEQRYLHLGTSPAASKPAGTVRPAAELAELEQSTLHLR